MWRASISDRVFSPNSSRTGTHTTKGVVIMTGEGIRQGNLAGASTTDIAPTILHLMGIGVPAEMDGHILTQAFNEGYLSSNPLKAGVEETPPGKEEKKEYALSDDEEKIIEKNLRSLGYI